MNNKNLPSVITGSGIALKNVGRSLNITKKLLANVHILTVEDLNWWNGLDNEWKTVLIEQGLNTSISNFDLFNKDDTKQIVTKILSLEELYLNLEELKNKIFFDKNGSNDDFINSILSGIPLVKKEISSINDSISNLSYLNNLNCLRVNNFDIKDLAPLSELKNLVYLNLRGNNVYDISAISALKNLETLSIFINKVSDITPLSNLTNLKELNIGSNNISEIYSLENLTNLEILVLNYNEIADLKPLRNLVNLEYLYLTYMDIHSFEGIYNLKNLKVLYLGCSDFDREELDFLQKKLPKCVFNFEG